MPPPPGYHIEDGLKISIDNGVLEFSYDDIEAVTVSGNQVSIETYDPSTSATISYTSVAKALDARSTICSAVHLWNAYGQ